MDAVLYTGDVWSNGGQSIAEVVSVGGVGGVVTVTKTGKEGQIGHQIGGVEYKTHSWLEHVSVKIDAPSRAGLAKMYPFGRLIDL